MPNHRSDARPSCLTPQAQQQIGLLLRMVHLPPIESALPDTQISWLMELRRKERERRHQGRLTPEAGSNEIGTPRMLGRPSTMP